MPKVQNGSDLPSLGYSNKPYLTVLPTKREEKTKRVQVTAYPTGEMTIRSFDKPKRGQFDQQKPPINTGERIQKNGISKKGRKSVNMAANYYQQEFGSVKMITVGYGDTSISGHRESKKDLDRFFKRLRAYVLKTHSEFHYTWVAEIQEKRLARTGESVIHYHIVIPYFVDKDKVNKWWNNAVNKPRKRRGLPTQPLYPNIINAWHAGKYIGKYLSKEGHKIAGRGYAMAEATSKAIKPYIMEAYDLTEQECKEMQEGAFYTLSGRDKDVFTIDRHFDDTDSYYRYQSKHNPFLLKEFIADHLTGRESNREEYTKAMQIQ